MKQIKVAIICGSDSDLPIISAATKVLDEFGVDYSINVASAHRTPGKLKEIIKNSEQNGTEVFIAAVGMAAALPGVIASETVKPVIGVPIEGKSTSGLDALFSIVQMPPGIPVGTVAIGKAGSINSAILALEILSIKYPEINDKLVAYRKKMAKSIEDKDLNLQQIGLKKYIEEQNKKSK